MRKPYPSTTCAECKDQITNTYAITYVRLDLSLLCRHQFHILNFRQRLIDKQCELVQTIEEHIKPAAKYPDELVEAKYPDELVEEEWVEEHLEDEGFTQVIALEESDSDSSSVEIVDSLDQLTDSELIGFPSVKNMPNPKDKGAIVKLIEEMEEKNQMILDFTAPHLTIRTPNRKRPREPAPSLPKTAPENENLASKPPKTKWLPNAMGATTNKQEAVLPREFVCDKCEKFYPSVLDLREHMETHPFIPPVECCKRTFMTLNYYKAHLKKSHFQFFQCSKCPKTFMTADRRSSHQSTHDGQYFKCPIETCLKRFKSQQVFDNHQRTHSGKPFWCDECPRTFNESYQLQLHKCKEHNFKFRCLKCLKFLKQESLKDHTSQCTGTCGLIRT